MSSLPAAERASLERLQAWALGIGVVALLPCVACAAFSPEQFFHAYLTAYLFYLGIGLGSMAILMVYHLTGGTWGFLIRRLLEAGMRTLPLLTVLFLPVAFGIGYLYLWTRPEAAAAGTNPRGKDLYLQPHLFWARAALYFACWLVLAALLSAWSRREDQAANPGPSLKAARLSGPGLVVYGITITFACVDWVMSLQPSFHSTIFGPLFASGQVLSGMAFVLLLFGWLVTRPPLANLVSLEALNDLGNLLLTFLVIWAYMVWFQFMLIWMANLPDDVIWYVPRSRGGWQWVAWALFVFHLGIPFFLLLSRDVKRDPRVLAAVAGLILFMQLVFMYYQVMPPLDTHLGQHWMDFLTPFGLGGIWLAYYLWLLGRSPLLPRYDPNQEEAVRLRELDREAAAREEALRHG